MSAARQQKILEQLFAAALLPTGPDALDWPPAPAEALPLDDASPHPIDDEDLLLDWSLGELSPQRQRQLLDHLAACPACRREIAVLVRLGIVEPHVDASGRDDDPVSEKPGYVAASGRDAGLRLGAETELRGRFWRQRAMAALVAAVAASLLFVFARGLWDTGRRDGAAQLALAQRDLQQGRAEAAFHRVESLLDGDAARTAPYQRDAAALLEASGYEVARSELARSDFHRVTDIEL